MMAWYRPNISERTPAIILPPALPIAMIATAMKARSPMLFFAKPATLEMTIKPAPEPTKKIAHNFQKSAVFMASFQLTSLLDTFFLDATLLVSSGTYPAGGLTKNNDNPQTTTAKEML